MTRMWMLPPAILCINHLNGEHNEIHKAAGSIRLKHHITNYIRNNCLEPRSFKDRHAELVREYIRRYPDHTHKSRLDQPDISYLPLEHQMYTVDRHKSLSVLLSRCTKCKRRYEEAHQ